MSIIGNIKILFLCMRIYNVPSTHIHGFLISISSFFHQFLPSYTTSTNFLKGVTQHAGFYWEGRSELCEYRIHLWGSDIAGEEDV